uniref:Uncharacterized protein n=1 Tax=Cacopsylla melanoneura TaxID=428564 RepID=A0A8D8TP97_9HEMI
MMAPQSTPSCNVEERGIFNIIKWLLYVYEDNYNHINKYGLLLKNLRPHLFFDLFCKIIFRGNPSSFLAHACHCIKGVSATYYLCCRFDPALIVEKSSWTF